MLHTLFFADTYTFGLLLKIEFILDCPNELLWHCESTKSQVFCVCIAKWICSALLYMPLETIDVN